MKKLSYSGVLYNDRRKFYLEGRNEPIQLYASVTPFISSLFARGGEQTDDKDYKIFEHRAQWRYQHLQADGAASWGTDGTPGDTATITVKNETGVDVDSSLIGHTLDIYDEDQTVRRGVVLVTAVSGSNLTVKSVGNPQSATEAIANIVDGDKLQVNSTAFGEGDDAPDAFHDELELVYNSVQRFKTAVEITEDLKRATLRPNGSPELARLRNSKQKEHKIKKEKAFLLGHRVKGIGGVANNAGGGTDSTFTGHITDANGNTVTTTMGLISALQRYGSATATDDEQNLFLGLDATTYQFKDFVNDTEKIFQYGGEGVKTAYCGGKVLSFFVTQFVSNSSWDIQLSATQRNRRIGFNFRILETPHGILRLVRMPIFRRTMYDNHMVVVDEEKIGRKVYAPAEYRTNIKTDNAPDLQKDVFLSWEGLAISMMETHSLWSIDNIG